MEQPIDKKSQRIRSVAYPSYTIKQSFELTYRISQQFGNLSYNTREDIAQQLDMSVGNLLMKLSSATQYGLLEMKSKEGYKPTGKFTSMYKPLSEDEKIKSEIDCLNSPEIYAKLIEHFKGKQLPAIGGLSVLLYRSYKVSEDASNKAAKVFLENISDLCLIGEDNRLIIATEESLTDAQIIPMNDLPYLQPQVNNQVNKQSNIIDISSDISGIAPPIPVFLKGDNRIAKLLMPLGFDDDDLEQVIKVISVYKKGK